MITTTYTHVYALEAPDKVAAQADRIRNVFLEALGMKSTAEVHFSILPVCGWIFFEDLSYTPAASAAGGKEIWTEAVRTFLTRARAAIQRARQENPGDPLVQFLPEKIKLEDIAPTWGENERLESVRLQFSIHLPAESGYGSYHLPVTDAYLSFYLSPKGQIFAVKFRWRAIRERLDSPKIPHPEILEILAAEAGETVHEAHEHTVQAPEQTAYDKTRVYMHCGENTYQTHLAPYYLSFSGHHAGYHSASAHSLTVDIIKTVGENEISLQALVQGGYGDYSYEWGTWDHSETESMTELGTADSCTVGNGARQVILLVTDKVTGACAQVRETLYFTAADAEPPQGTLERPGCTNPDSPNYDPDANSDDESCNPVII